MNRVVLLRHGQSVWNMENRFTGWVDVDLSSRGVIEAHEAAGLLVRGGFGFDVAYTSFLKRAIRTLWIVLDEMDLMWIPVEKSWVLNERHYGMLQGLDKAVTAKEYGAEQIRIWRRSYSVRQPAMGRSDPQHPFNDHKYAGIDAGLLPSHECLEDTFERVVPYWEAEIVPRILAGERVLIAAHGNTLRALAKHLENISDDAIADLNIPTGIPLVYELDNAMRVVDRYYLGDAAAVRKAAEEVARQGEK